MDTDYVCGPAVGLHAALFGLGASGNVFAVVVQFSGPGVSVTSRT